MTSRPLVSVVIATYNMEQFLAQSIRSVLDQSYDNLEVLVIDDGSTDRTADVVESLRSDPRLHYRYQENGGQCSAKNAGIKIAQGDYISFNDADDIWYPQKIARQLELFANPEVGVVYSERDLIDQHGNPAVGRHFSRYRGKNLSGKMLIDNFIPFSTCVVARRCIEEQGMFDQQLEGSIDYDLWLRYSKYYAFDYVDQPLAAHRVWSGQMSQGKERRYEAAMMIQERFVRQYGDRLLPKEIALARATKLTGRGAWKARSGKYGQALADFGRAIWCCPTYTRNYKALVKLVMQICQF